MPSGIEAQPNFINFNNQLFAAPDRPNGEGVIVACTTPDTSNPVGSFLAIRLTVAGGVADPFVVDPAGCGGTPLSHTDANGNARVVWFTRRSDGSLEILTRRFDGRAWLPITSLGTIPAGAFGFLFDAKLAVDDASGEFVVGILAAVTSTSGSAYAVGGRAEAVTSPLTLLTGFANPSPFAQPYLATPTAQVALRADGEALTAVDIGTGVTLFTRVSGSWSAPVNVGGPIAGVAIDAHRVIYDAFGKAELLYATVLQSSIPASGVSYTDGADNAVLYSQRQTDGTWAAPLVLVEHVTLPATGFQVSARFTGYPFVKTGAAGLGLIAADDGPVALTWSTADGAIRSRVLR